MSIVGSILGTSVVRLEDPALLLGGAAFIDDLNEDDLVHVAFVRSAVAHGEVVGVDVADARSMPGVFAVFHARGDDLGLAPMRGFPGIAEVYNRPVFARERVRFVGDVIAAVVAETAAQAADAAQRVIVDIEALPTIVTPGDAIALDVVLLFAETESNVCFATEFGAEVDPIVDADVVVELTMVSQRLAGAPMETNGVVAIPTDGGLTMWISHQAPHTAKARYAPLLGLDGDSLRVVCPWVGGGFGPKAAAYVEHVIAGKAAMELGRPVKWVATRSEDMVSLAHGRDFSMSGRLGLTDDGRITGLDVDTLAAAGAYPALGGILPTFTQMMAPGVYDVPKLRFRARSVLTNTTTIAAYRGAGRPEATQLIERLLDVAADRLDIDPVKIRRRNFIAPDRFPFTTITGARYDSGDYGRALDAVLDMAGYDELRAEQATRRQSGDPRQIGIGVATYVEVTAGAGMHEEFGAVEIHDDGSVSVYAGTSAHGQGHHTSFAMLASDVLGIPIEQIDLVDSDTLAVSRGKGTMASRSLQIAGSAIHQASEMVLDRAKQIAAQLLEASADDIVVGAGGLHVIGVPSTTISWADLAVASRDPSRLPDSLDPGDLRHELDFAGSATFPFGAHISVVEVDIETGAVTMLRHVAVDDCGRVLNPLLVAGQQHGGIAQGAAQALYEWVQYDSHGNPVTSNLADYAVPSAADLCSFEVANTQTDSPNNPLGAKGIGESGTIGSTPAIQNAVVDAVSHLGVEHIDMPCTPERVWSAIRAAQAERVEAGL